MSDNQLMIYFAKAVPTQSQWSLCKKFFFYFLLFVKIHLLSSEILFQITKQHMQKKKLKQPTKKK